MQAWVLLDMHSNNNHGLQSPEKTSRAVHLRPQSLAHSTMDPTLVRLRPWACTLLAVRLAVTDRPDPRISHRSEFRRATLRSAADDAGWHAVHGVVTLLRMMIATHLDALVIADGHPHQRGRCMNP
jgi:hypothetical protein